jgi:hypothetical protein
MSDESNTTIGKRSKISVGLAMGLAGSISYATAIRVDGQNVADRVTKIEVSRESSRQEQQRVNTKILKWLSAIGQRLDVPEPPAN